MLALYLLFCVFQYVSTVVVQHYKIMVCRYYSIKVLLNYSIAVLQHWSITIVLLSLFRPPQMVLMVFCNLVQHPVPGLLGQEVTHPPQHLKQAKWFSLVQWIL